MYIVASKAFRDINLSFKRHPVTNDVLTLRDEDAIKRSVKNIVFTIKSDRNNTTIYEGEMTMCVCGSMLHERDCCLKYINGLEEAPTAFAETLARTSTETAPSRVA